jgi:hypothetical protein
LVWYAEVHYRTNQTSVVSAVDETPKESTTTTAATSDCGDGACPSRKDHLSHQEEIEQLVTNTQSESSYSLQFMNDLKTEFLKPSSQGWHRTNQRKNRKIATVTNLNTPLEAWELEMIEDETRLLHSQGRISPLKYLAYAWGQEYDCNFFKPIQTFSAHTVNSENNDQTSEVVEPHQHEYSCTQGNDAARESLKASYDAFLAELQEFPT